jgi:hypothetical protein
MWFFGRRKPASSQNTPAAPSDPIGDFWRWWPTAKGPLAEAIATRTLDTWAPELTAHVQAIDPKLAWELGRGVKSRHHLCVTGEGDARLRITAERWLSRAPEPDAAWEYYPARQPSPAEAGSVLRFGGVELPYDELRFNVQIDDARRLVHVVVFHPNFRHLDEEPRTTATALILDDLLGEDGAGRWLGDVEVTLDATAATQERSALVEATKALSASAREDDYTLLEGEGADGHRMLAMVNFGVKRLDHLLMESHVEISIQYPARGDGLYASESVGDDLSAMEDVLLEMLGKDAAFIGHETGRGRRVIHLHVAPDGPALGRIAAWERAYPTWEMESVARADPQWDVMRRW